MIGSGQVVESTRAGNVVQTANVPPRCFRVVDGAGRDVTGPGPVDMATAFRVLDSMLRHDATGRGQRRDPIPGLPR